VITDLKPFYESDVRTNRAVKRARALAMAKGIPIDQFIFTQLALIARESGSPKHRANVARVLEEATASLVGSPLVIIDPETRDVTIYTVVAAQGTNVVFEGDDEWFDLADFAFEWRLFDPAVNQLADM
jgi:hypothetical protein